MFPIKPPEVIQKAEQEKKMRQKNKKNIAKKEKDKSSEKRQLERTKLQLKVATKLNKASFVKDQLASTSSFQKLSSNFKIPKKVPAKLGHPGGSGKHEGRKKPDIQALTPNSVKVPKGIPNTRTCLDSPRRCFQSEKVMGIPEVSPLFEVQKWLIDSEEGGKKSVMPRPVAVVEDTRNSNDLENEEEPMVIDADEVVGSIHQIRVASIDEGVKVCGSLTELSRSMSVGTNRTDMGREIRSAKEIFLVLDTNVLASDLGLVDDLRRSWNGENGSARLVLVVPWAVLQELDRLKDDKMDKNPSLKTLAAGAVRYLHDLLMSGDSQIKGQTVNEVSEDVGWDITCNDDRILQCCFQCKKKCAGEVILFTNDRNLCNKAMVNKLKACSKDTVLQVIEQVTPLPASRKKMLNVNWDGKLESGSNLCDEILCQVKGILHKILEAVLRTEMFKAFEELWTSVVKIKPPWRLEDILKCLQMHWIAVFGQILPKKAKEHLEIICAKFRLKQVSFGKDDLKALLIASLRFLSHFENSKASYSEDVTPCIHQIRNLLDIVKNIRLATYQMKVTDNAPCGARFEANVTQLASPDNCEVRELEMVQEVPPEPMMYLKNTLHTIWNFMNNTCALIFDSLGMENPIVYQRPDKLLPRSEARNTIPQFYATLRDFGRHLETVLRLGEFANPEDEGFGKLAAFVDNFFFMLGMDLEMKFDETITSEAMFHFCTNKELREKLIAGFHQLEDLCNLLYRCILEINNTGTPTQSE